MPTPKQLARDPTNDYCTSFNNDVQWLYRELGDAFHHRRCIARCVTDPPLPSAGLDLLPGSALRAGLDHALDETEQRTLPGGVRVDGVALQQTRVAPNPGQQVGIERHAARPREPSWMCRMR